MTDYVGLDVSMEETSVCVIDAAGSTVWEGKVVSEPSALVRVLERRAARWPSCCTACKLGVGVKTTSSASYRSRKTALAGGDTAVLCVRCKGRQDKYQESKFLLRPQTFLQTFLTSLLRFAQHRRNVVMTLMGWTAPPTASMCQIVVVEGHKQRSRP